MTTQFLLCALAAIEIAHLMITLSLIVRPSRRPRRKPVGNGAEL